MQNEDTVIFNHLMTEKNFGSLRNEHAIINSADTLVKKGYQTTKAVA